MTRSVLVTCPECSSSNIEQQACGGYGWLRCRTCGHRWNEEDEVDEHRVKRKTDAERERLET
jgi:transposase-like protein